MNIEEVRAYCLSKKEATESMPFDDSTVVFKVGNKMFALLGLGRRMLNVKCDPELAISLREEHSAIREGYHMNKRLWNSLYFEEGLSSALIKEQIDQSYALVVASLTKKLRAELGL